MSLVEKVKNFGKSHSIAIGIGSIVIGSTGGLALSYSISKHDALGHFVSWISDKPYHVYKIEVKDRLTRKFMERYDLNRDGAVTEEEYRRVMKIDYK